MNDRKMIFQKAKENSLIQYYQIFNKWIQKWYKNRFARKFNYNNIQYEFINLGKADCNLCNIQSFIFIKEIWGMF